jgi:hypothetical protein
MIADLPISVKLDIESDHKSELIDTHSTFAWYFTERAFSAEEIEATRSVAVAKKKAVTYAELWGTTKWQLLEEAEGRKGRVLEASCHNSQTTILNINKQNE